MTYTDEQLEKAASGKAIDDALDAVLKAAGSGLRHYTLPGTLSAMREMDLAVVAKLAARAACPKCGDTKPLVSKEGETNNG